VVQRLYRLAVEDLTRAVKKMSLQEQFKGKSVLITGAGKGIKSNLYIYI
jgi:FlaA1/EpsC-like NDP-sugar epimerase